MMILSEKIWVSAIVCTHNGRDRIEHTLMSLNNQSLLKRYYEIIVVDNCSTDGTLDWLKKFQEKLRFNLILENEIGLSSARNSGIRASSGDLIFFTDDDAVLPAHHLETILNDQFNENADVVGGAVHGLWENTPPIWLLSKYWRRLSLVSYGNNARQLVYPEILIGCNVAFHRSVFEKYGYFDSSLGRKKNLLFGNEERLLEWKIMKEGGKVWYNPNAYVFHLVSDERLEIAYFKTRTKDGVYSNLILQEFTREKDSLGKNVEKLFAPRRTLINRFFAILQICWFYFRVHVNFFKSYVRLCFYLFKFDSNIIRISLKGRLDYFKKKYHTR